MLVLAFLGLSALIGTGACRMSGMIRDRDGDPEDYEPMEQFPPDTLHNHLL